GAEVLCPLQRGCDESPAAGLERERGLAYVGMTRAKRQAKVSFAQNRRTRGLYQPAAPSRFIDELPAADVEVAVAESHFGGGGRHNPYGASRFDEPAGGFPRGYSTPAWHPPHPQCPTQ